MGGPGQGLGELSSWKEIAAHLGVSVRTAQMWERDRGLPVRRMPGGRGGRVFITIAQVDTWKEQGNAIIPPNGGAAPSRLSRRLIVPVLAVTVLLLGAGVASWSAIGRYSSAQRYQESLEGRARALAASDFGKVQLAQFIQSQAAGFKRDMRSFYLPEWQRGARKFFPIAMLPGPRILFHSGYDTGSGFFLELLRREWQLTGDQDFLAWYVQYANELGFELTGETNDYVVAAIVRYADALEHIPSMLADVQRTGMSKASATLSECHARSLAAARMLLGQYDPQSRSFAGSISPGRRTFTLVIWPESGRSELLCTMARSPHLGRILNPTREDKDFHARYHIEGRLAVVRLSVFYRMLLDSAVTASQAFVRSQDGKSFARAVLDRSGRVERRQAHTDLEPGYFGNEDEQAVQTQTHVAVLLGISERLRILDQLTGDDASDWAVRSRTQLRDELGNQYGSFIATLRDGAAVLRECQARLFRYLHGADWRREYLFLPGGERRSPPNLPFEVYGAAMYAYTLGHLGRVAEHRQALREIFANVRDHFPESENQRRLPYTPGLFFPGRYGRPEWVGSVLPAHGLLLRNLEYLQPSR